MKSGTSSLYQWLGQQPEISLPELKEPHFFSRDEVWARGLAWYSSLFPDSPGRIVGEASTTYTNPDHCSPAAQRMAAALPGVRLVYLLRHPVERLRSHYRHALLQGEERRPLLEVLADTDNRFLRRSLYHTCLLPYTELFARDQILVVRLEDLFAAGGPAWSAVLAHLGLSERPRPTLASNVSSDRQYYTSLMRHLRGPRLRPVTQVVPRRVRRAARPALVRAKPKDPARRLEASHVPIPDQLLAPMWDDVARLERWLGKDQALWPRVLPSPARP